MIKNSGANARLSCKDGNSSPRVKLTGDFGNAIEVIRNQRFPPVSRFREKFLALQLSTFATQSPLKADILECCELGAAGLWVDRIVGGAVVHPRLLI